MSLSVEDRRGIKTFTYDRVFSPTSTQDEVFKDTSVIGSFFIFSFWYNLQSMDITFASLLMDKLEVEKRIIFELKDRHTMTGPKDKPGIIPRAMYQIFDTVKKNSTRYKFNISCYMLELYNDKLVDLLTTTGQESPKLAIKKDEKVFI